MRQVFSSSCFFISFNKNSLFIYSGAVACFSFKYCTEILLVCKFKVFAHLGNRCSV